MKNIITVKPNPSKQERDHKVLEISFNDSEGNYKGLLVSLDIVQNKPILCVYRIDKGIDVRVDDKREENV